MRVDHPLGGDYKVCLSNDQQQHVVYTRHLHHLISSGMMALFFDLMVIDINRQLQHTRGGGGGVDS